MVKGKDFAEACLSNADELLKTAKILAKNKKIAYSMALCVLSLEETAKAFFTLFGKEEVDDKHFKKFIKSHQNKLFLVGRHKAVLTLSKGKFEGYKNMSINEYKERLTKLYEKNSQKFKNIVKDEIMYSAYPLLKEKWLYVDIEDGKIISPLNWNKKEDAQEMIKETETLLNSIKKEIK